MEADHVEDNTNARAETSVATASQSKESRAVELEVAVVEAAEK